MADPLSRLVDALRCLPGIGPKSAQRMVYHLLQHQRERGLHLASCLEETMRTVQHCERCNNFTVRSPCHLCLNINRNSRLLCIVETPADAIAIEQSNAFDGFYFVLMNKISPIDGIGPEDIGLPKLKNRVSNNQLEEVIIALSPTIEGQTTVYFIQEILRDLPLKVSQLAHGIPAGGELEYLDMHTIGSALRNRAILS